MGLAGCDPISLLDPGSEEWAPPSAAARPRPLRGREPCALHDEQRIAFFGDLHVHTAFSMDAVTRGAIATPDDAYRFARGETIGLPPLDANGEPLRHLRLGRPLDFAAVTEHAEWLSETSLCMRVGSPAYDSAPCRIFRGEEASWMGRGLFARIGAVVGFFGRSRKLCGPEAALCREELARVWKEIQAAAERWYDRSSACSFTTFHAWEYSASPGRSKVHRNVILRNEIVPELPISWIDEPEASGLWRKLDRRCNATGSGCEALAIPHNPNLSNGQIFVWDGAAPLDRQRERARLRARLEPLVEMVQTKGESECRSGFAGVIGEDELCGLDKIRFIDGAPPPDCGEGKGSGAMRSRGCQSRLDFARYVLIEGLALERKLGVNPYRLGWIGSTDTHNGTPGATEEATFAGHNSGQDAGLEQRLDLEAGGEGSYAPRPLRTPGGLVGIWAEENSRDALFDAMKRREVFATSGTRIVPRFFGGFDLPEDFCERDDGVEEADRRGVPMGGVLPAPTGASERGPVFAVSALRDPGSRERPGGRLQRIQIVKGWVGDDGGFHQQVVDVAGHAPDQARVDRETCEPEGPGADLLCAVWRDPDFDSTRSAIYYARILENPSCRWNGLQCNALAPDERPAGCSDPAIPWQTQERAWTSAIWVVPSG